MRCLARGDSPVLEDAIARCGPDFVVATVVAARLFLNFTGRRHYLLSQPVPALPYSNFTNIVGRLPREGEFVARLDGLTQMYTTNSFDGFSWSQGEPQLNVGEAAFFNLVEVPEPSSIAIICIGLVGLWCGRRRS